MTVRIELKENEFMQRFVGPDHVECNDDQFWYQLLTCSFNFMKVQDPKTVDKTLGPFIDLLALNNSQSLNLGSLIRVAIDRISRIKSPSGGTTNPYYVYQSFNALYLIRSICKNYIENSSEQRLVQAFSAKQPQQQPQQPQPQPDKDKGQGSNGTKDAVVVVSGSTMLEQFISVLIEIIVDVPLNDSTYLLQVESINSLIVLLSVQMYSNTRANQSVIFKSLMQKKASIHALVLTKTLLQNFIQQQPVPEENGSVIIGLASGLWKVLTLGYSVQEEDPAESMPLLARQSLFLLNVLTNHYTTEKNPYREALISCQDVRFTLAGSQVAPIEVVANDALATASTSQSVLTSNSIKIDFDQIYETMCKHLQNDQVALLLYLLLHSNKIFKPYILTVASPKLDQLILPLLKILHSSIQLGSHHIYMVLIIFLILSEEQAFNESIHKISLKGGAAISWFKDRLLTDISLGSFTTLIMIRSFQYNTFRVKDKFLHTNLFATLANLSNHFKSLHPYVCQRLVDLLERLAKINLNNNTNYNNATTTTGSSGQNNHNNNSAQNNSLDRSLLGNNGGQVTGEHEAEVRTDHVEIVMGDSKEAIDLVEATRMLLEVVNNSLASQMVDNPDLIYTLLYKRKVFSNLLMGHNSFYHMVINIERILTYFYEKIESYQRQLSVDEIKALIQTTSLEWNQLEGQQQQQQSASRVPNGAGEADPQAGGGGQLLLFRYVEDEQPEDFFIPYMWTKIYYSSGIAWNPKRIVLFNPELV